MACVGGTHPQRKGVRTAKKGNCHDRAKNTTDKKRNTWHQIKVLICCASQLIHTQIDKRWQHRTFHPVAPSQNYEQYWMPPLHPPLPVHPQAVARPEKHHPDLRRAGHRGRCWSCCLQAARPPRRPSLPRARLRPRLRPRSRVCRRRRSPGRSWGLCESQILEGGRRRTETGTG